VFLSVLVPATQQWPEWLPSLPVEKRVDYNHLSTLWRRWNA
jgi:hypothetical protein